MKRKKRINLLKSREIDRSNYKIENEKMKLARRWRKDEMKEIKLTSRMERD
jgi:hypothetical protein